MDNFGGINGATGLPPEQPQVDPTSPPPVPPMAPPAVPDMPDMSMPGMAPQVPQFEDPYQTPPSIPADPMAPAPMFDQPMQPQQPPVADFGAAAMAADMAAPAPVQTGGAKKVLVIAIGAVVGLALLGGIAFAAYSAGKSAGRSAALKEFQAQAASEQQKTDESTDGADSGEKKELVLGDLKDPEYKDETVEGAVGEQMEASDGLVLMVTNIERNYKPTDANYKLDETKELVKVNFLMGNVTKDKTKDISNFNFRLENSSGAQLTPESIAEYEGKFDTVKLDPGTQSEGSVVYAVNKDEKPLVFTRSQVYRITNQNREVTTKLSVKVSE